MYYSELFHHVENFFFKRFLLEIQAKYFFIGAKMLCVETEWRKAWWRHGGWETSFAGPGGNSANPEARRSFLRESWRLCTPSLPQSPQFIHRFRQPTLQPLCFAGLNSIVLHLPNVTSVLRYFGPTRKLFFWSFKVLYVVPMFCRSDTQS